eukprot:1141379-Pelagomonas_calceolata.AAC.4
MGECWVCRGLRRRVDRDACFLLAWVCLCSAGLQVGGMLAKRWKGGKDLVSTGSGGCIPNGGHLQDSIARPLESEDQLVGIHGWTLQFWGALA